MTSEPVVPRGSTWAVVSLRLGGTTSLCGEDDWGTGPLPMPLPVSGGKHTVTDGAARRTYLSQAVGDLLYEGPAARRVHRFMDQVVAPSVRCLGVELHRVQLADERSVWLLAHLVVEADGEVVASVEDRDLAALTPVLHPTREGDGAWLRKLAEILGLPLETVGAPWFALLREAADASDADLLLHGAATGASPRAAARTAEALVGRQALRMDLSSTWACEVGPRGLGFVLRGWTRGDRHDFHDRAAPTYVRSIYVDQVQVVRVQDDLLADLAREAAEVDVPSSATSAHLQPALDLQRKVALYRTRLWWSTVGRGGERERWFGELQAKRELRERLDDLAAESVALRDVLTTAVAAAEAERGVHLQRSFRFFGALLAAAGLLAVPQTLLGLLALPDLRPDGPAAGLLSRAELVVVLTLVLVGAVVLGLLAGLVLWGAGVLRSRRRVRQTAQDADCGAASHAQRG